MCEPASFVATKKAVYWGGKSESHSRIIQEHNLKEMDCRSNIQVVCVEITPPNGDFRKPFKQWKFHLDSRSPQDKLPPWYDAKDVERRCRAKLKEWRKAKVIMPNESCDSLDRHVIAVYGTVESIEGGTVKSIYGGTVKSIYGGTVEYIEGGTVKSIEGGTVKSIEGGTVKYIYGGTVKSIRGGTVKSIYGGTVKYIYGGTVKSIEGGTVKYIEGGTVEYIYGGTVKSIRGGTVKSIYGGTVESIEGGTVKYIEGKLPSQIKGNATIIAYSSLDPKILKSSQAVIIDRTKDPVVCFVGKRK